MASTLPRSKDISVMCGCLSRSSIFMQELKVIENCGNFIFEEIQQRKDKLWARSILRYIYSKIYTDAPPQNCKSSKLSLRRRRLITKMFYVETKKLKQSGISVYTEIETLLNLKNEHALGMIIYFFQETLDADDEHLVTDHYLPIRTMSSYRHNDKITDVKVFIDIIATYLNSCFRVKVLHLKENLIQDSVTKMVLNTKLYSLLLKRYQEFLLPDEIAYKYNVLKYSNLTTSTLCMSDEYALDNGKGYDKAIELLSKLHLPYTPTDKLQLIQEVSDSVNSALEEYTKKSGNTLEINGDIILEIFTLLVLRSQTHSLPSQLEYVKEFIHPKSLTRSEGYYFTTLEAALSVVLHPPKEWDIIS